jgi:hypothetical protein
VLPAVLGTCALAIGMQNVLGGFLLAIVSGNSAEFLQSRPRLAGPRPTGRRSPTPIAQPAPLPAETVRNT